MALGYGEYAMRVFGEVPGGGWPFFWNGPPRRFPTPALRWRGRLPKAPCVNGAFSLGVHGRRGRPTGKAPQIDWEVRRAHGLEGLEPSSAPRPKAPGLAQALLLGEVGSARTTPPDCSIRAACAPAPSGGGLPNLSPRERPFSLATRTPYSGRGTPSISKLEAMSPFAGDLIDLLTAATLLRRRTSCCSVSTTLADDAGK